MQRMNSSCHILLVEDSRTQATNLLDALSSQGWLVDWVGTAEAAMERIQQSKIDLVVLDFYLPGMRGDALCRKIRTNAGARDLPILILTAEDTRAAEVHLLESGADDFVLKSTDGEILLRAFGPCLPRRETNSPFFAGAEPQIRAMRS